MILGSLKFLIGFVGVTLLFWAGLWAGFWWDGRPAHTPRIHIPLLFGCCTWEAPESLKAKLGNLLAQEQAAARRAVLITRRQGEINTAAAVKEAAAQVKIRYVTNTLTREVHDVVTAQMDRSFPVSTGLTRLHDAAALGLDLSQVPDPAGRADDQPSDLKSSQVISAIIANYGAARSNAERLTALQAWINDTTANFNQGPPT